MKDRHLRRQEHRAEHNPDVSPSSRCDRSSTSLYLQQWLHRTWRTLGVCRQRRSHPEPLWHHSHALAIRRRTYRLGMGHRPRYRSPVRPVERQSSEGVE